MGASNTKCSDLDGTVYTQIEIDNYQLQRQKLFMSTIIICIIYAIISLILILLGSFTNIGKELIFITYLPFTIVFIIGSIIIILYFSNKIHEFKPYKLDNTFKYDNNSCPDYWDLVKTNPNNDIMKYTPDNINSGLLDYTCKANPKIYKKSYMLNKLNNDPNYNPSLIPGVALKDASTAKLYSISGSDGGVSGTYYSAGIKTLSSESYNYDYLKNLDLNDSNHLFANLNAIPTGILKDNIKHDFNTTALNMAGFKTKDISDVTYGAPANTKNDENYNVKVVANVTAFGDSELTNRPKIGADANAETLAVPLLCDKLYPKLLASKDDKYNKDNPSEAPNPYRCAYSKICGVSWSDVDCAYEK
jgi:hypothetical protein